MNPDSPQGRRAAKRDRAGAAAARKLFAAVEALSRYLNACRDCQDGSGDEKTGIADGRHILIGSMAEYATWLDSKKGGQWAP